MSHIIRLNAGKKIFQNFSLIKIFNLLESYFLRTSLYTQCSIIMKRYHVLAGLLSTTHSGMDQLVFEECKFQNFHFIMLLDSFYIIQRYTTSLSKISLNFLTFLSIYQKQYIVFYKSKKNIDTYIVLISNFRFFDKLRLKRIEHCVYLFKKNFVQVI